MSEGSPQPIGALRLYFPISSKAGATRFWHRLTAPALADHLLAVARQARIVQAVLHQVSHGYLPGQRLSHHHPELTGMRHPQCLELLDTEQRLRDFALAHAEELRKVHAVLFLCELPLAHTSPEHAAFAGKAPTMTSLHTVLAIGIGAMIGALLRYALSLSMNAFVPHIPMGTLASNLIAAYIVGVGIAFFGAMPNLSPAWRLFVITGLAGGLSTFSTFSAELLVLLREGRLGWSAGMLVLHVGGSLLMTILGMATVSLARET